MTDQYMVIFRHPDHLKAWRRRLEHLVKMSKKYTMSSLLHPIVPPQEGFKIHGVEIDQVVKSFALAPAGSEIHSNHALSIEDSKRKILQRGGYEGLVDGTGHRLPAVLLRIVGVKDMKLTDVLQAILYDGQLRNMPWDIVLNANGRDTAALELEDENQVDVEVTTDTAQLKAASAKPKVQLKSNPGIEGVSAITEQESAIVPEDGVYKAHEGKRFVIFFNSQDTAHQFARTWHCRPIPLPLPSNKAYSFSDEVVDLFEHGGELRTKVYAEVLW